MRLIDADAAKENTVEKWTPIGSEVVSDFLDAQPTSETTPVVYGWWWDTANQFYKCASCGREQTYKLSSCPYCGARIDAPALSV